MEAASLKHAGETPCDVVEVRWDKFHVPDEELIKCDKPILLTYRAKDGEYFVKPRAAEMKRLLSFASMVDVDVRELVFGDMVEVIKEAKNLGLKVILSAHLDCVKPDSSLITRYANLVKEHGADYLKVVPVVNRKEALRYGLAMFNYVDVPLILQGIGAYGKESRYVFAKEGSEAIYGHLGVPANDSQPSMYEIQTNLSKELHKVYLVWKCTDDSENCWPTGAKELLDVYDSKEEAVARVNEEKNNIKWAVMGMLHSLFDDSLLKIEEKNRYSRYDVYSVEGRYGDITVELSVEERLVL